MKKGRGRDCSLAEVSFPPPSKEQKGEGWFVNGGGKGLLLKKGGWVVVDEGGGRVVVEKRRKGIVENVDLEEALRPHPQPPFFFYKVACSQGQTPSKNNVKTLSRRSARTPV